MVSAAIVSSARMVSHRLANDLSGEKIEHDSQIEPSFLGWDIGYVSKPDLIRPLGGEFLGEPVGAIGHHGGCRWCMPGTRAVLLPGYRDGA